MFRLNTLSALSYLPYYSSSFSTAAIQKRVKMSTIKSETLCRPTAASLAHSGKKQVVTEAKKLAGTPSKRKGRVPLSRPTSRSAKKKPVKRGFAASSTPVDLGVSSNLSFAPSSKPKVAPAPVPRPTYTKKPVEKQQYHLLAPRAPPKSPQRPRRTTPSVSSSTHKRAKSVIDTGRGRTPSTAATSASRHQRSHSRLTPSVNTSSSKARGVTPSSTQNSAAKKKFDLAESLKRPVTWTMKTGPVRAALENNSENTPSASQNTGKRPASAAKKPVFSVVEKQEKRKKAFKAADTVARSSKKRHQRVLKSVKSSREALMAKRRSTAAM